MLLVRVDRAGIGLVRGVTEETVLAWLRRAAQQAEAINRHLLRNLPVTQVQLDEMWNVIERKYARQTDEAGERLPAGEDGRRWVWISFAPELRLMIAAVVGPRTLETAKEVVAATNSKIRAVGISKYSLVSTSRRRHHEITQHSMPQRSKPYAAAFFHSLVSRKMAKVEIYKLLNIQTIKHLSNWRS